MEIDNFALIMMNSLCSTVRLWRRVQVWRNGLPLASSESGAIKLKAAESRPVFTRCAIYPMRIALLCLSLGSAGLRTQAGQVNQSTSAGSGPSVTTCAPTNSPIEQR